MPSSPRSSSPVSTSPNSQVPSESSQPRTVKAAAAAADDDEEDDEVVTTESLLPPSTSTQDEKDDIFRQRKRDREGSLEPGKVAGTGLSTPDAIPTKKNRLGSASFPLTSAATGEGGEEQDYFVGAANQSPLLGNSSSSATTKPSRLEGEKVGHIRERVRDLSWKGTTGSSPDKQVKHADDKTTQLHDATMMGETTPAALADVPEGDEAPPIVPHQEEAEEEDMEATPTPATFAQFASKSSGFATAKGNSITASSSSSLITEATQSPPPGAAASASPMRTQPTFSAFSSGSSPFSSSSASVAGPSWLAGKSGSSSSAFPSPSVASSSGVRPSTLGTLGATTSTSTTASGEGGLASPPRSSLSPATSTPTSFTSTGGGAKPVSSSTTSAKQLGFGAFASSSGFAPHTTGSSNGAASPAAALVEASGTPNSSTTASSNSNSSSSSGNGKAKETTKAFEEKLLREAGSTTTAFGKTANKVALPLAEEKDLTTGEEDERTVASARAKLYTMDADSTWKERGTGTLRCNIPKSLLERKKPGRLVMRAEGVYRLILNVALFKGMRLELSEKFVRLVALEEGKYVHFAIKFSTPAAALSFHDAVSAALPKGETGVAPVA